MTTAIPPQPAGEQEPRGSMYPLEEGATPADVDAVTPTPAPQPYIPRSEQADDRNTPLEGRHSLLRATPTLAAGRAAVAPPTEEAAPAKPLLSRRGFLFGMVGAAGVAGAAAVLGPRLVRGGNADNQTNNPAPAGLPASTPNANTSPSAKPEATLPATGNIKAPEKIAGDQTVTLKGGEVDPATGKAKEVTFIRLRDPRATSPDLCAASFFPIMERYLETPDEDLADAILQVLAPDFQSIQDALEGTRSQAQANIAAYKRVNGDAYVRVRYLDFANNPVSFKFSGAYDADTPPDPYIVPVGQLYIAYLAASGPDDPGSNLRSGLRSFEAVTDFKIGVSPEVGFYPFHPRLTGININTTPGLLPS